MRTQKGGEPAKEGFYFNLNNKEIVTLEKDDLLPGEDNVRYLHIPLLIMLIGGPVVGLLYVMFLPFISFAMLLTVGFQKAWKIVRRPKPETATHLPVKIEVAEKKAGDQAAAIPAHLLAVLEQKNAKPRKEGLQ